MLTRSQDEGLRWIKNWWDAKGKLFRLGGPAGSGKSYLITKVVEMLSDKKVILMTPTGKAAVVLQKAGLPAATIHSTIYEPPPEEDEEEPLTDIEIEVPTLSHKRIAKPIKFILKDPKSFQDVDLFIIDEGSMVGEKLMGDVLSFDVPVLIVGDPNQLPPVNDASIFRVCDYYLQEIVRQSQGSPIIYLSQQVLAGSIIPGWYGSCLVTQESVTDEQLTFADVVVTDTNSSRDDLNSRMRGLLLGNDGVLPDNFPWIAVGDVMICRDNNFRESSTTGYPLTNGTIGTVAAIAHISKDKANFLLKTADTGKYDIDGALDPSKFPKEERPHLIEYGYALTVHLSQGSEWGKVIYVAGSMMSKRSLYTAITRAKESVLISLPGVR